MWADKYLHYPYKAGARGPTHYDCWGMVWAMLAEQGVDLPPFGRVGHKSMQNGHEAVRRLVKPCRPQHLAIAAVYEGAKFVHVGLCLEMDRHIWVQHTGSQHGPSRVRLIHWEAVQPVTRYYRANH